MRQRGPVQRLPLARWPVQPARQGLRGRVRLGRSRGSRRPLAQTPPRQRPDARPGPRPRAGRPGMLGHRRRPRRPARLVPAPLGGREPRPRGPGHPGRGVAGFLDLRAALPGGERRRAARSGRRRRITRVTGARGVTCRRHRRMAAPRARVSPRHAHRPARRGRRPVPLPAAAPPALSPRCLGGARAGGPSAPHTRPSGSSSRATTVPAGRGNLEGYSK